jgi:methionyl-tRNA formyltransferase
VRDDPGVGLRIVAISTVQPLLEPLVPVLRELGHEPVAIVSARRRPDAPAPTDMPALTDASAPAGVDLLFAKDSYAIEPLLRAYEPDVALCWGFPWKIPLPAL